MIFCDEAAFFSNQEQLNLRDVIERYISKSNPSIVLVSTPNKPDDIMEKIMHEPNSLYTRLFYDYRVGLNKMWTEQEIEIQKQSPSFQREYNLKFLGEIGNIYNIHDIETAIQEYTLDETIITSPYFPKWGAIDPAFGRLRFWHYNSAMER